MKKRIVTMMLAVLLALVYLALPALATVYEYFPDVPDDAPYADAVNMLAEMGIVKGDENGNFNPNNTITRAEFATMMCRLLGVEDAALAITKSSFNDVPADHWACGYVTKAVELGLVNGYGNGNFGPSDTLTYEQAVKVLVCAWGYEAEATEKGGWPKGYAQIADEIGITKGTQIMGAESVNRSVVAALFYNAISIVPFDEIIDHE